MDIEVVRNSVSGDYTYEVMVRNAGPLDTQALHDGVLEKHAGIEAVEGRSTLVSLTLLNCGVDVLAFDEPYFCDCEVNESTVDTVALTLTSSLPSIKLIRAQVGTARLGVLAPECIVVITESTVGKLRIDGDAETFISIRKCGAFAPRVFDVPRPVIYADVRGHPLMNLPLYAAVSPRSIGQAHWLAGPVFRAKLRLALAGNKSQFQALR